MGVAAMDQAKIHVQTWGLPLMPPKEPNPGVSWGEGVASHRLNGHLPSRPEMAFKNANRTTRVQGDEGRQRSVGGGAIAAPNPCGPIYVHTQIFGTFLT